MSVVVVHATEPYWRDVLVGLVRRGVPVTHAIVNDGADVAEDLEDRDVRGVVVLDAFPYFSLEEVASRLPSPPPYLGGEDVAALEECEHTFLLMTDRAALFPVSVRYRKRLFRELVRYWSHFLSREDPEVILFFDAPHYGWDLVLFEVARRRGIRTAVVRSTSLNSHVFLARDSREVEEMPARHLEELSESALRERLRPEVRTALEAGSVSTAYLRSRIGQPQELFDDSWRGTDAEGVRPPWWRRGQEAVRHLVRTLGVALRDSFRPGFFLPLAMNRLRSRHLYRVLRIFSRARTRGLRRAYEGRAGPVDRGRPFAYFAMHLQPERTSLPEGGRYEDQLLAVDTLTRVLPEGWLLYVKENPLQLREIPTMGLNGWLFRDPTDYRDLLRLPGVRLVGLDESVDEIVDHAEFVSTLTGTSGWEGMLAGKPALCFGAPWYGACPSCYLVDSRERCREALEAARRRSREDVRRDVLRFLVWFQEQLFLGSTAPGPWADEEEVATLADWTAEGIAARLAVGGGGPRSRQA